MSTITKTSYQSLIVALILLFAVSSCVTRKKYDDLSRKKSSLELDKADCEEKLISAEAESKRLSEQVTILSDAHRKMTEDSTRTGEHLRRTLKNYNTLNDTYEKLLRNHDRLASQSASDLARRERELLESEKKINELRNDLQEREARVKELEKVLADKEKAVNDLKAKVSNALLSFKEKDLTIDIKNGKVYVSLAEQLLFKSGSTEVDPKGVEALRQLASVLRDQKDISIMVEGHTDDVPISRGTVGVKDNWDLSVLRATSIVRILTSGGVSSTSVIPAGRGEYSPVDNSKTKEGRQKNRRTEIILTPRLDELFKILEAN